MTDQKMKQTSQFRFYDEKVENREKGSVTDVRAECNHSQLQNDSTKGHIVFPEESQSILKNVENHLKSPLIESSFKTSLPVATILPVNPMEAWTAPIGSQTLTLFNDNGEEIRTAAFPAKVQGFSVLENKDIIFSNYEGRSIHLLTRGGKVSKLVSTSPFSPNGIQVITESQQFIVCLIGTNGGKIVRYSKNGTSRLKTIMNDKTTGLPLFKFPRRVTRNDNGDLGVVDLSLHSLIVVDDDGCTRWIYKGSEESRRNGVTFDPWDVCVDRDQNYLVSNTGNHSVDLLDKNGKFLRYILTTEHGIKFPLGLSFDSRGTLWLGQATGTVTLLRL
ncbi:hypothetical protein FSP39_008972 [Pinctada imbricata]|uniref:Tripartite motif-containing protein 3 n=1 Tax=Pinctada imbricata TaxID=66713 RepID=A0AA88Y2X5_PINIB|nr:hypothetical protein FSP39_008972 [Pinctada imbricata]